jgi:hypothetical protein
MLSVASQKRGSTGKAPKKEAPQLLGEEENCNGEGRIPLLEKVPSLDDLSRELASGTISRRRAMKLAAGALLGSALIPLFSSSPAEARRRNPCRGKNVLCEQQRRQGCKRSNPNCVCMRTTGGGKACVDTTGVNCPTTDECDRNSDCGRNEVCAVVAGCCQGSRRNLCIRRCS